MFSLLFCFPGSWLVWDTWILSPDSCTAVSCSLNWKAKISLGISVLYEFLGFKLAWDGCPIPGSVPDQAGQGAWSSLRQWEVSLPWIHGPSQPKPGWSHDLVNSGAAGSSCPWLSFSIQGKCPFWVLPSWPSWSELSVSDLPTFAARFKLTCWGVFHQDFPPPVCEFVWVFCSLKASELSCEAEYSIWAQINLFTAQTFLTHGVQYVFNG